MWFVYNFFCYLLAGIIGGSITFAIFSRKFQKFMYVLKVKKALNSIKILEITNEQQCQEACSHLKLHCQDLSVLGIDCQWNSLSWQQKPVALLQLATVHGLCCLFRLNKLGTIHKELKELLSDSNIIKLGMSPLNHSCLLREDYYIQVSGTLDLRHLYPTGKSIASLAASVIGVKMERYSGLGSSDWEALELTDSQKDFAAKGACLPVEIFKKWLFTKSNMFNFYKTKVDYNCLFSQDLRAEITQYLDLQFKPNDFYSHLPKTNMKAIVPEGLNQKKTKSNCVTRKSPLYHNCFMYAPDGELLCSCDKRKAQWYVDRGLAEVMPGESYSIRLLFTPAAKADETNEGKFYQQLKENCCVVCGAQESYLRHNVVPKEYRKHFPKIMKDHQSHDIVLMCSRCHHLAADHNENLKRKLANLCDAPIAVPKVTCNKKIQKVKNSAKALLNGSHVIPLKRKIYLANEIVNYFNADAFTPELLLEAANLDSKIVNDNYESHGFKVVNYFRERGGGLTKLEILWREHFLSTMKPQHLPALWSVTHNHMRLAAKEMENKSSLRDYFGNGRLLQPNHSSIQQQVHKKSDFIERK